MRRRPQLALAIAFGAFLAAVLAVSFLGSVQGDRTPGGVELVIQLVIVGIAIALIAGAVRRRG